MVQKNYVFPHFSRSGYISRNATIYILLYNKNKNKNVATEVEQKIESKKFQEPLENKTFANVLYTLHYAHVEHRNILLKE